MFHENFGKKILIHVQYAYSVKCDISDYAALHGILPAFYVLHTSGGLMCDPT
jgi:hypothetical protein